MSSAYGERLAAEGQLESVLAELPPLIEEGDLQIAQLALSLLTGPPCPPYSDPGSTAGFQRW